MQRNRDDARSASLPDSKPAPQNSRARSVAPKLRELVVPFVFAILALACGEEPATEGDELARARALQNSGRFEQAIPLLRELISDGDRSGEVMYRYGRGLSLIGQPGRGIWALEEAQKDPEWFVNASQQIALDAFRGGNHEVALAAIESLKSDDIGDYVYEDDLPTHILELRTLVETRRMYDEALALADTILEDHPDHEHVLRLKAVTLLGLKQTDAAYEVIKQAGITGRDPSEGDGDPGIASDFAENPIVDAESEVILDPVPDGAAGDDAASKDDQTAAYWCTVRTTFKREAGELAEAAEILDECLAQHPTDSGLLSQVGELYPLLGRTTDIEQVLLTAIEADPDREDLRISYVQLLDDMGRDDEAEQALRDGIEVARQRSTEGAGLDKIARRLADLGAFLVDHDRGAESIDPFGDAIEMLGRRASPDLLLRQAEALTLAGRFEEALEIADLTIVEVHRPLIRGRVAFERADYQTAIDELNEVARMWPDNAPSRYYLARAREGVGDFDLAVEDYRQAMRTDPRLSAARERLARLHLAEGHVRQAATILNFASPRESSTASGAMKLLSLETEIRMGQEPDLRMPQSSDLTASEVRRGAIRAIARGVAAGADPLEAEAAFVAFESVVTGPRTIGVFVRERVRLLIEGGESEAAIDLARQYREVADHPDLHVALARALTAAGTDLTQARTLLQGVDTENTKDVRLVTALGEVEEKLGDGAASLASFERALAIDEGHWPAMDGLVRQLVAQGRSDVAMERLKIFLDRHNPYEGRAALVFAQRLADDASHADRVRFIERALRFSTGTDALDYLREVDPERASHYRTEVVLPVVPKPESPSAEPVAEESDAA